MVLPTKSYLLKLNLLKSGPQGEDPGERSPHCRPGLPAPASVSRRSLAIESEPLFSYVYRSSAGSPLAKRYPNIAFLTATSSCFFTCLSGSWPRSRETSFKRAMGMQSYSRLLCLSREKHHRLYLQQ